MSIPDDVAAAIRAAAGQAAEAPPDPTGFWQSAAEQRQRIEQGLSDETSIWFGRPDQLAAHDRAIALVAARHGLVEPPKLSPQEIARQQVAASFPNLGNELHPFVAAAMDADLDRIKDLSPADKARLHDELLAEFGGPGQLQALRERARAVADPQRWPEVQLSRRALVLLAGVARYRDGHARATARLR